MCNNEQTYSISIEELALAFMALPDNSDNRLRFVSLPMPLQSQDGQVAKYPLQFDWNDSCNDWELCQGQDLMITASDRTK